MTIRYGFSTADESYYVAIVQRLLQGDRLLIDESSPGQFFGIFLFLPYKLFADVTGGTEGLILFMRCLFLAFNAVFFWVMYRRLRPFGWPALIASLLFSLYVPMLLFACNHYTVPVRLLMLVCLVLFSEKQKPASLLLAGVLLACSVLYQPSFALLYFGFTVLVWVRFARQKKNKPFLEDFAFCLHTRAWIYMTVSVVLCAAAFLGWLFVRGGLRNVLKALPLVLQNPELDFSVGGDMRFVFFEKIGQAVEIYGLYCLIPALAVVVLSIAYARGLFRKERSTVRKVLFCLACAVWTLSCVPTFRLFTAKTSIAFFAMYPASMLWFGIECYLLCERKNKRFLLFWAVGLASSLCVDVSSHETLSLGSPIAYIADLVFFADLVRELRAERLQTGATVRKSSIQSREKRITYILRWCGRLICVCFSCWFACILFFENTAFPEHFSFGSPLFSLPYVCTDGPWRSLHVSQFIGEDYERHLADIDTIKEKKPENLFVCGLAPELYLYADLPYAALNTWGWRQSSFLERQIPYWKQHPERRPACIYLPVDQTYNNNSADELPDWMRENLAPLCDYTAEQGQGGYIVYVSQWHLDAAATAE